jgi:hypothetical protein
MKVEPSFDVSVFVTLDVWDRQHENELWYMPSSAQVNLAGFRYLREIDRDPSHRHVSESNHECVRIYFADGTTLLAQGRIEFIKVKIEEAMKSAMIRVLEELGKIAEKT